MMLIWIVFAVMTVVAVLAVLVPLARARGADGAGDAAEDATDVEVYKHQLGEVDSDFERGLIGEAEATAARTEIARRLIAAEARAGGGDASGPDTSPRAFRLDHRVAALAAIVLVPALALTLYLPLGAPDQPGQPLAERLNRAEENQDIAALVRRVERVLAENPEDGRGWDVLAPVYARIGRFEDSARAFRNATRLLGPTANREAGLGVALVGQSDGLVTEMARQAFQRALAIDPHLIQPRFYLALAAEQDGDTERAIDLWRSVVTMADDSAGEQWRTVAAQRLSALTATAPDISQEQIEAVQGLDADQQAAMVEQMVGRLAARLDENDQDLTGWLRLTNAYVMLGREDDARQALDRARSAFQGDTAALTEINQLAASLGIGS